MLGREEPLTFHYRPYPQIGNGSVPFGLSLNSSRPYIINASLEINSFSDLNRHTAGNFVIVTAASDGHFHIAMDAIARAQKMLPGYKIIFYDLNAHTRSSAGINKVSWDMWRMAIQTAIRGIRFQIKYINTPTRFFFI